MKKMLLLLAFGWLLGSTLNSQAALQDVEIKIARQKLDEEIDKSSGYARVSTKEIQYTVTVQSKTFKQLSNIEVKYMIFYYDSDPGSKSRPEEKSQSGSEKILALAGNRSVEFQTKSISLTSVALEGNVYWMSGASGRSKDRVSGIWIRVFSDTGAVIGEYASPSSVTKRDWKD